MKSADLAGPSNCWQVCDCDQWLQVPQLGCLHFNNCRYIAHEMVTLAYITHPHPPGLDPPGSHPSSDRAAGQPNSAGLQTSQTQQFLEVAAELNAAGQRYLDQQVRLGN